MGRRSWFVAAPFTALLVALAVAHSTGLVSLAVWSDTHSNSGNSLGAATLAPVTSLTAGDLGSLQVDIDWSPSASTWAESYQTSRR